MLQVLLDDPQKIASILVALAFAHAAEAAKGIDVARQQGAHLLQGAVVENDVGRYALGFRQRPAALAQSLPERDIDLVRQGLAGLLAGRLAGDPCAVAGSARP